MSLKTLKQIHGLKNKRVLVRVDFNVPIKKGKVLEDARLLASVPTIKYLLKQKAKVVLVSHLGRPEGVEKKLSLGLVAKRLEQILKKKVVIGGAGRDLPVQQLQKKISMIRHGQIFMFENIRFFEGERNNDDAFSKQLAELCDVFVLDGFAVAHRDSPSVSGIAKYVPSYAGLLLEKEIKGLDKVIKKPKKPFVAVLGGVKMETKIPVMKNLLPKCNYMLIGGGIANTYFKAKGYSAGSSLVDMDFKKEALLYGKNKKVIKPIDVVVGTLDGKKYRVVEIKSKPHEICKKGEAILDCGPKTIQLFATYIKKAQTLVWNGAMGYFEQKPYDVGTLSIARLVASRSKGKAYGVVGGGETLQSMDMVGMTEYIDLVSTGGGAMLEYLSGKELPGIVAVSK